MKELYIVRHAIAEDRVEFAKKALLDSERPITEQGRHKMIKISEWLSGQIEGEIDLIAYSPLLRSKQTCELLKKSIKNKKVVLWNELDPSTEVKLLKDKIFEDMDIKKNISKTGRNNRASKDYQSENKKIMIVGHEPQLTNLIHNIFTSNSVENVLNQGFFKLKKGGVVCIIFKPEPVLKWFVSPKNILP